MKQKASLLLRIKNNFRMYSIRGLLVLVPIGVTVYVLIICYNFTAAHLVPLIKKYWLPMPEYVVIALSVFLFFSMLYIIGVVATAMVGRRLIGIVDALLHRIPLVKTVYGASKRLVQTLSVQDAGANYQAAVYVDFPRPGVKSIAFVTGMVHIEGEGDCYKVFVPTTPNPTSGYLQVLHPRFVYHADLSVEDAVKMLMSAGIIAPHDLVMTPALETMAASTARPLENQHSDGQQG